LASPDFGYVINQLHHNRLGRLLENTGGEIFLGGKSDGDRKMELTLVKNVELDDILMEE